MHATLCMQRFLIEQMTLMYLRTYIQAKVGTKLLYICTYMLNSIARPHLSFVSKHFAALRIKDLSYVFPFKVLICILFSLQ